MIDSEKLVDSDWLNLHLHDWGMRSYTELWTMAPYALSYSLSRN